jgi:hypothetical protein
MHSLKPIGEATDKAHTYLFWQRSDGHIFYGYFWNSRDEGELKYRGSVGELIRGYGSVPVWRGSRAIALDLIEAMEDEIRGYKRESAI